MEKLAIWIEQNQYEFSGNIRGHIITASHHENSSEGSTIELQVPVKKI